MKLKAAGSALAVVSLAGICMVAAEGNKARSVRRIGMVIGIKPECIGESRLSTVTSPG